jgi:hypothetical protein
MQENVMPEKMCPLISMPYFATALKKTNLTLPPDQQPTEVLVNLTPIDCQKTRCAWYNAEHKQCLVWVLFSKLCSIENSLAEIPEEVKPGEPEKK